jgi:hypothetical protein
LIWVNWDTQGGSAALRQVNMDATPAA